MDKKNVIVEEAMRALRLSRRYKGKFADDEFEFAAMLLGVTPH